MNIFQKSFYTDILKEHIREQSHTRGYQSRLAEAAGVHTSYISRVLKEQVHLTPDQAALLCAFWKYNSDETDYFLTLVHHARASSKELKTVLKRQVMELKKKHDDMTHRYVDAQIIQNSNQELYYSAWYYSAIHFLVMIPNYQTVEAVARRLQLPEPHVISTLNTLKTLGLVTQDGKKWKTNASNIHMSNSSLWASVYHSSYRQRTAFKIHERTESDMHYTGLHPMSEKDFLEVKALLQDTMEKVRSVALPSPEEELYCISLDWFKM